MGILEHYGELAGFIAFAVITFVSGLAANASRKQAAAAKAQAQVAKEQLELMVKQSSKENQERHEELMRTVLENQKVKLRADFEREQATKDRDAEIKTTLERCQINRKEETNERFTKIENEAKMAKLKSDSSFKELHTAITNLAEKMETQFRATNGNIAEVKSMLVEHLKEKH